MVPGRRLDFPATRRNREPIFAVLAAHLPKSGLVVEIAAGSGQHAAAFAPRLPEHTWLPTDIDPTHVKSIHAWREAIGSPNLLPAEVLDACTTTWPVTAAAAIFSANMIHIAPWSACEGLFQGAERILDPGGRVFLYGPFLQRDRQTAPSNVTFDCFLRSRDAAWGIRSLDDVEVLAARHGFMLLEVVSMPANNLTVIFERCA